MGVGRWVRWRWWCAPSQSKMSLVDSSMSPWPQLTHTARNAEKCACRTSGDAFCRYAIALSARGAPMASLASAVLRGRAAGARCQGRRPRGSVLNLRCKFLRSSSCRLLLSVVAVSGCTLETSIRRFCMHVVQRTRACCIRSCSVAGDSARARERGETLRADVQRLGSKEPFRVRVCGAPSLALSALFLVLATRTSLALDCPRRPRLPSPPPPYPLLLATAAPPVWPSWCPQWRRPHTIWREHRRTCRASAALPPPLPPPPPLRTISQICPPPLAPVA